MVLTTLTDLTLDISIWSIKKIYNISYWLLYSQKKSKEELLLENIIEMQNKEHKLQTEYSDEKLYKLIEEQKKNIDKLNIDVAKLTEKLDQLLK